LKDYAASLRRLAAISPKARRYSMGNTFTELGPIGRPVVEYFPGAHAVAEARVPFDESLEDSLV
jgi:hypothetical protein